MNKGIVYRSTGSWYLVKDAQGVFYSCRIKGKFRIQGIKSTNPIAVGDRVEFDVIEEESELMGVITAIDTRDNYIVRRSVNLSKQTHIIASNIDQAFLLITLNNPPTFFAFIDRFLITAEAYHIPAVLLFNKMDTYGEEEKAEIQWMQSVYEATGYTCYQISSFNEKDVALIESLMQNKSSMFRIALKSINDNENNKEFEEWFLKWVRTAFKVRKNKEEVLELISWSKMISKTGREVQKNFLSFSLNIFRSALLKNYEINSLVSFNPKTDMNFESFSKYVTGNNIEDIFCEIEEAHKGIESNGNANMIFMDLSLKLTRLIQKQ